MVGVSVPRLQALTNANKPVPNFVRANLLIDTGASHTSIDNKIIEDLEISPTGEISMHTPSTGLEPVKVFTYDVQLLFAGHYGNAHNFQSMPVFGCDLSAQGIHGLFGRDALEKGRFIFSGPDNLYMLSF